MKLRNRGAPPAFADSIILLLGSLAAILSFQAQEAKARDDLSTTEPRLQNEEVTIRNEASDTTLSGTLTMPKGAGPFPAAMLLSVGFPNDRDMTHPSGLKLFRTLAEHLGRNGIATLRCDDRGIGGSTGSYFATTLSELATDALAGVEFLKKRERIDPKKVGMIGNSEGAVVGAISATRSEDVAFVVMLGGVGVPAEEVLRHRALIHAEKNMYPPERIAKQMAAMDSLFAIVTREESTEIAAEKLKQLLESDAGGLFEEQHAMLPEGTQIRVQLLSSPWYRAQLSVDPPGILARVRVPVLALTGDLDRINPADQNLPAILAALEEGRNSDYTVTRVPGLNHIFQKAKEGGPEEYMTLREDFSPMGAEMVSSWIRIRFE